VSVVISLTCFVGVFVGFWLFGKGIWELDDYSYSRADVLVFVGPALSFICAIIMLYIHGDL
jgi:hypothetical protein